jgi:hypothetical protein
MRKVLAISAIVGAILALAPEKAAAYENQTKITCTLTSAGLPGGTQQHRLTLGRFWTDPATMVTGYAITGFNLTTTADSYGYGHTSANGQFPISLAWTDSPTFSNSIVRHWRVNLGLNLIGDTRLVDLTTNGNFTAAVQGSTTLSNCITHTF